MTSDMMSAQNSSHPTTSTSPPRLDSSTRNLLDDFMDQKKKERALFQQLQSRSSSTFTSKTRTNNSSSASSVSGKQRNRHKETGPLGRNVLDLLPRGRSGQDGSNDHEEDEASLLAQAEALADLERLNGVEPSLPISTLRVEESDDDNGSDESEDDDDSGAPDRNQPYQMDVDEFRRYFGERWQLSQFWYSSEFSYHLARCLFALLKDEHSHSLVPGLEMKTAASAPASGESEPRTQTKKIGFICSPTAYVAFRNLYPEIPPQPNEREHGMKIESYLFDHDERFSLLTLPQHTSGPSERFVQYDLNKPLIFPSPLEQQLDMVVIDPPYLNAETNLNIAQTVKKLLKSEQQEGKVLLITGQSISAQACEIYGNEKTGPLRRAEKLEVEHVGLQNDFGAWGNWDGVERFGGVQY